jgi:hypothetical protein
MLVRDPRAVLASRKLAWKNWPQVLLREEDTMDQTGYSHSHGGYPYLQSATSVCSEHVALRDAAIAHPELLVVNYEDVRGQPLKIAQEVFRFAFASAQHEDLPEATLQHIRTFSTGDCVHQDAHYSVCRKNASGNDDKWKSTLSACEIKMVQEKCQSLRPGQLEHVDCPSEDRLTLVQSLEEELLTSGQFGVKSHDDKRDPRSSIPVVFKNMRQDSVDLYWIESFQSRTDVIGNRVKVGSVLPGHTTNMVTSMNHKFIVHSASEGDVFEWKCESMGSHVVEIPTRRMEDKQAAASGEPDAVLPLAAGKSQKGGEL